MSHNTEENYPELRSSFTVFIMINTDPKRELKVADILFVLPEVKEVHCMHGKIDILAKIVLTRDLLTSDAEVIDQFVQGKVRKIKGILSTVTLIPGSSQTKK